MSMIEGLRLIAAVSVKYASEATKAIRVSSDTQRQLMYNSLAQSVLSDPDVQLTTEDRKFITSLITEDDEGGRDYTMRIRLNATERSSIEKLAEALKMSVSETVRGCVIALYRNIIEKDGYIEELQAFINDPLNYHLTEEQIRR